MVQTLWRGFLLGSLGVLLLTPAWAQYEEHPVPLGDVARSLRKKREREGSGAGDARPTCHR